MPIRIFYDSVNLISIYVHGISVSLFFLVGLSPDKMSSHAEFSPYKNVEVTSSCDACMWLRNYLNLFSPNPLTSISELFNYMITHHILYLVDCLWYMCLKTECLYVLRFSPAKKFIRQSHIVYLNKLMMQLIPFHGEGNGFNFIRSCRQRVSKPFWPL